MLSLDYIFILYSLILCSCLLIVSLLYILFPENISLFPLISWFVLYLILQASTNQNATKGKENNLKRKLIRGLWSIEKKNGKHCTLYKHSNLYFCSEKLTNGGGDHNFHHHHLVRLIKRNPLVHHLSLSSLAHWRSSKLQPVSAQYWCKSLLGSQHLCVDVLVYISERRLWIPLYFYNSVKHVLLVLVESFLRWEASDGTDAASRLCSK